jgi:hypothetical protein
LAVVVRASSGDVRNEDLGQPIRKPQRWVLFQRPGRSTPRGEPSEKLLISLIIHVSLRSVRTYYVRKRSSEDLHVSSGSVRTYNLRNPTRKLRRSMLVHASTGASRITPIGEPSEQARISLIVDASSRAVRTYCLRNPIRKLGSWMLFHASFGTRKREPTGKPRISMISCISFQAVCNQDARIAARREEKEKQRKREKLQSAGHRR